MSSDNRSNSLNAQQKRRINSKTASGNNARTSSNTKGDQNRKNNSTNHNAVRNRRKPVVSASSKSNSSNNVIPPKSLQNKNSSEMATSLSSCPENKSENVEQETNVDFGLVELNTEQSDYLQPLLETSVELKHEDNRDNNTTLLERLENSVNIHKCSDAAAILQRIETTSSNDVSNTQVFCQNDDEINHLEEPGLEEDERRRNRTSSMTIEEKNETSFLVYSLGCCEFDETQLVSISSSKAIQKCILTLSNQVQSEGNSCWGINHDDPILMKLYNDHIQFVDLTAKTLLRSQPIETIKSWAVDDDNNFAFVVEDRPNHLSTVQDLDCEHVDSVESALLREPNLFCYVFRSMNDDDMSWKVAKKLNEEINKNKEELKVTIVRNNRLQQMVEKPKSAGMCREEVDELENLEDNNDELSINVKYIGSTRVCRASGIDVLNMAVDKCLADASKVKSTDIEANDSSTICPLEDARIHISPSSVIIENITTGAIIVECRIRYLTFMGISRRDIRWCGFIMQNQINKTFEAYCIECYPTAAHVCEAIQNSCNKMYEKVLKNTQRTDVLNIIPNKSKIRETIAKTFSRIKLR